MTRFNYFALAGLLVLSACAESEPEEAAGADVTADAPAAPATEGPATEGPAADPELSAWLATNYADLGEVLYRRGEADLDGDGTAEIFVYLGGPMMCGSGGCNLVVLQRTGQGLDKLGDLSVSRLPVGVFASSTNGWRDLAVTVSGGGIAGGVARVPFGEDQYSGNPTVPPATMTDEAFDTVIADGPLEPLG